MGAYKTAAQMLSAERECCSSTADGPTNVSTLSSTQPLQLTDLPSDVLEVKSTTPPSKAFGI
jgi:hypothetical protein